MEKRDSMKRNLWFLLTGFCLGFAPKLFRMADLERGYNATGGEVFIFLIPVLAWLIWGGEKHGIKRN